MIKNGRSENGAVKISRKIYTPQLMVIDISDKDLYDECERRMYESEAHKIFNMSVISSKDYNVDAFSAVLIHHFPREGGSVTYGDLTLEYIPQPIPPGTMRMRLYIACPCDRRELYNYPNLQRVGLIGSLIQTFIAVELSNFNDKNTNDLRPYIPFFDDCWAEQRTEVPMEDRTMTSIARILMTDPQFTNMMPSVAFLELDRTYAELDHERHLAKYIRERLSLLGQLDANNLLHLVFFLTPEVVNDIGEKDNIETLLDVSVIKSGAFHSFPTLATFFHRSLRELKRLDVLPARRCWRVENKYIMQPTFGGKVASYLGAVVHEVVHLLKIPHTTSGIMFNGGENIQTFFLPVKKLNLGFMEKDLPILGRVDENVNKIEMELSNDVIIKQIMESSFDSTTKLLMTLHPLISHKPREKMCPILYDEDTGVVNVESGVRYLAYFTDDDSKLIYSFTEQYMRKTLVLKTKDKAVRALIVTGEGNFFSVLVTNTS